MQIRVSPDALRSVAQQQDGIMNNIGELIAKIDSLGDQLGEAWKGASGTQALNSLETIRAGIKQILAGASDSGRKLISIADAFESVDSGEKAFSINKFPNGVIPMPIMPTFVLSMPGMVSIDPDRVRDIAEQCKSVLSLLSENSIDFANSIKSLSNDWEGKAYVKYENETSEIIDALRKMEDSMAEFISKIVNAANRYEEIDNSL